MHRSVLGGGSHPPPVANMAICLYCRNDMRQIRNTTRYFDAQPSWKQINYQNAIISAVLHGHFQSEAGGVRRSVDELPAYLSRIGRDGMPAIHLFGNLHKKEVQYLIRTFDKAIQCSRWLDPETGKSTMLSSSEFKRYLLEKRELNRKVQS
jgi:hypothetical protein